MRVTRTAADAFTIAFDDEEELRAEHRSNLVVGGLHLRTPERLALHANIVLTLRVPSGTEMTVKASVVAQLADGVALMLHTNGDDILNGLTAKMSAASSDDDGDTAAPDSEDEADNRDTAAKTQTVWDRIRGMQRNERLLLAAKAERVERALLVQDNDPMVLLSLLKNPRVTVEEVVRIAKSSFLTFQIADTILKSGQWMGSLDVRVALIQNPKTPPPFAMRILPTLPESELRAVSRGATSMALKQAALRKLQGG